MNQVATIERPSLLATMATKYHMEPTAFANAIKSTVIQGAVSNEQFAAFLMVAHEYGLNPLTKEIYAFPAKGGITPIVSIDGWMNLINSHPQFDGMEFTDVMDDKGQIASIECRIYRKDRARHSTVIEYMSECYRPTEPWKKWPNRMLRHKAAIQCARYAFGFAGIMEPDEFERMKDVTPKESLMDRLSKPSQSDEATEGFGVVDLPKRATEPDMTEVAIIEAMDADIIEITDSKAGSHAELEVSEDAPNSSKADAPADLTPDDSERLLECVNKLLGILNNEDLSDQERQEVLTQGKDHWKDTLDERLHEPFKKAFTQINLIRKNVNEYSDRAKIIAGIIGVKDTEIK